MIIFGVVKFCFNKLKLKLNFSYKYDFAQKDFSWDIFFSLNFKNKNLKAFSIEKSKFIT